jgi:hypothetical protein
VCGYSKQAPEWATDLAIAQEAGIRPWRVEDMPAEWYYRIKCWIETQNEAEKVKK